VENIGEETDLSYWQLLSGGRSYILPKDTFILAKKSVRFSESVTALPYALSAELRYPNGTLAVLTASESPAVLPQVPINTVSAVVPKEPVFSKGSPSLRALPSSTPAAAIVAAKNLPEVPAVASSHVGEYKWFYLLGALLSSTLLAVFWLGRAREEIEIIEETP
jgi:hypothetical protein